MVNNTQSPVKTEDKNARDYTELVFECAVCKKIYKKPGMCDTCNVLLKPKGE